MRTVMTHLKGPVDSLMCFIAVNRIVNCFMHLLTYYAKPLLLQLDVGEMTLACIYVGLIVNNFRVARFVYDYGIVAFFSQFQSFFHEGFKWLRKVFETNVYHCLGVIKDILLAFLSMVISKTPTAVQLPLQMLGVTAFLDKQLEKFNEAKAKIEQKEEQRELERNRPGSPLKEPKVEV